MVGKPASAEKPAPRTGTIPHPSRQAVRISSMICGISRKRMISPPTKLAFSLYYITTVREVDHPSIASWPFSLQREARNGLMGKSNEKCFSLPRDQTEGNGHRASDEHPSATLALRNCKRIAVHFSLLSLPNRERGVRANSATSNGSGI